MLHSPSPLIYNGAGHIIGARNRKGRMQKALNEYRFKKRPLYVQAGGSIAALGNITYTPTVSAVIGQLTATFVLTGHRLVKGSRFWVAGYDQAEFNGMFIVLSVNGNDVVAALVTPATATAGTGTAGALELENMTDGNFVNLGNCLAGQRMLYAGNFAQGGSLTAAHVNQVMAALLPANNRFGRVPEILIYSGGGNDILAGIPVATIIANWELIIAACYDANVLPVFTSLPPLGTSHGSHTDTLAGVGHYLNHYLKDQYRLGRIDLLDVNDSWLDKASADGNWKSGYTADYIHPLSNAAYAAAVDAVVPFVERVFYDELGYTETELWTNPQMTGTGGIGSGVGISGVAATGFSLAASGGGAQTVVGDKVGSFGVSKGEGQKITFTAGANQDAATLSCNSSQHALLTAGDNIVVGARVRSHDAAPPANFKYLVAGVVMTVDGVLKNPAVSCVLSNAASVGFGAGQWDFQFEFPMFTVPSGLTSFNVAVQVLAGGVMTAIIITVCDISIKKITL